jgi:hypothetical protein
MLQEELWTAWREAVQDQFRDGGSLGSALLVGGLLIAIIVLTFLLTRRQERTRQSEGFRGPARLFHDLMNRLPLSSEQKRLLQAIARRNKLPHPTVLLLSPALFDQYAERYHQARATNVPAPRALAEAEVTRQTRRALYPDGDTLQNP